MEAILFLLVLGLIWIIFAVFHDWKTLEIPNWLNFSLIIFALGFRFFYSLFSEIGFSFFYQGLIGLGIFFVLGNIFYYGRFFAGGDAKLMIALGPILPLYKDFFSNINVFVFFLISFLFVGLIYGMGMSLFIVFKNKDKFKKEFYSRFKNNKKLFNYFLIAGLILIILGFFEVFFIFLGIVFIIFPILYFSAKSIDESIMIKNIQVDKLREGDWLYNDVRIEGESIKSNWEGLTKKEIKALRESKEKVKIRQGFPFAPVFLFSFITLIIFYFFNEEFFSQLVFYFRF